MDRRHETIDALLDGERVDPIELKEALARAEGRDYLVDALALRELVAETSPAGRVAVPVVPSWQRRIQWPAAAAILVASLLAGFAAGYRSAGQRGAATSGRARGRGRRRGKVAATAAGARADARHPPRAGRGLDRRRGGD